MAVVVYLLWTWWIHRFDAAQTRGHANLEEPTVPQADIALLVSAITSLIAVGLVLLNAGGGNAGQTAKVTFAVASVVVSWTLVHTILTLRYASQLYSGGPDGGMNFRRRDCRGRATSPMTCATTDPSR